MGRGYVVGSNGKETEDLIGKVRKGRGRAVRKSSKFI